MRLESIESLRKLKGPVLITGHTGFKGTWLTLLLESQGVEVFGISLEPTENSLYSALNRRGMIHEKFLDICDFESLKFTVSQIEPAVVFHLAAQSLVLESYRNPLGTFKTNIIGTANLLESVNHLKEETTIVSITTDKVYENLNSNHKYSEGEKLKGKDPYSSSKVGAEAAITAWRNMWTVNGSHRICAARAGNVVGGGDLSSDRLIPDVIRSIVNKDNVNIRNPKSKRPWQHVLDPLIGYVYSANALLEGKDFECINFGPTEQSLSVEEVLGIASNEFKGYFRYEVSKITTNNPNLESSYLDLDSTFANKNLKWLPKWDQKEAIIRTFSWWKSVISKEMSAYEACKLDIEDFLNNNSIS
jgi:CDP-glucose 4,6-dehydratase